MTTNSLKSSKESHSTTISAADITTHSLFHRRRRLPKGYNASHLPNDVQALLRRVEEPNIAVSLTWAVLYLVSILVAALFFLAFNAYFSGDWPTQVSYAANSVIYLMLAIFVARQQRGLELMVHDASHGAWLRSNKRLNDRIANLVVAYPMLSSVQNYWQSHVVHHGHYGTNKDPCRQRFERMGLGQMDFSKRSKIALAVVTWLPAYNREYYAEIGSASFETWRNFITWHSIVVIVPTTLLLGMYYTVIDALFYALMLWLGIWLLPAVTILPVIRSIAEAEEHDYEKGATEFDTTFTNFGLWHRILFHPWHDAYHLIHHMFPQVPQYRHPLIHELLMKHDDRYQNALHRNNVLESI